MIDFLIGTPYSFRNFNCWDYVVKVRDLNNIKTKLFKPKNTAVAFECFTAEMQKLDHGLLKTDTPENFDIVIVKKDKVYHCGLYYNGDVVHCSRPLKQVVSESLSDFKKPYSECTFWR